jgi:UDP-3-O-[3-hydroxymyristoyl] glucosamine N-acyltransferase
VLKDERNLGIAVVEDPTFSFYELHNKLVSDAKSKKSRHQKTVIKSRGIHKSAFVSPLDVTIGRNVIVEPRAIILPGVTIGNGSIVRAGAVVGSEGFENKRTLQGLIHVEHAGKVSLGENVDVGANTCICKGLFPYDTTTIGSNTKIDQLVHVAHNVQVGRNCNIVASALIGGSTIIEDDCWIGPSAVLRNNIVVGAKAFVTLGAVVTKNVMPGQKVSGVWAIDHDRFVRLMKSHES